MRRALALVAVVALACGAPEAPVLSVPARPTPSAPPLATHAAPNRCAADPYNAWLDPRDRACTSDADCVFVVAADCGFAAIHKDGARRARYDAQRCAFWPDQRAFDPGCQCSVPGMETRCAAGCCQRRIIGGTWEP